MSRRTIFSLIVLVAIGAAGFLAYIFLRPGAPGQMPRPIELPRIGGRAPLGTPEATDGATPPGRRPEDQRRLLRQIVDKDVLAPTLSADGKGLYYLDRSNGHILKSDLDGSDEQTLTSLTILEAYDAVWSPKKNQVVIFYHESGTTKKFLSGVATGTPSRFLPSELKSLAWSPDGRELAYLLPQGGETRLLITDPNSRQSRVVFVTPIPDFTLSWAARNIILLISRPSGLAPSLVVRLDPVSRQAEPLIFNTRGITLLPAPDGGGFIYSRSAPDGQAEPLAFHRLRDGVVTPINVSTIAEKCAFSPDSKKLLCGVPQGLIQSPSPDAWYQGLASFTDAIHEINIETGAAANLNSAPANLDVISPLVSPDGKHLFFQNKKDGTVWRLTLKE